MRLIHIVTALVLFSLFSVLLFDVARNEVFRLNPELDYESDDNVTRLFTGTSGSQGINIISETGAQTADLVSTAPGGVYSTIASSDATNSDIALEQGSYATIVSTGRMLYSIPKAIFTTLATFLKIDSRFGKVASMLLILLVTTILVSSILKNRL